MDRHLLMIGFPKCASTSIFHLLQQHPSIEATEAKETRLLYPAIRDRRPPSAAELDAFSRAFPDVPGATVGFEASPATVFAPEPVARAVADHLPGLHAVVVLRDPADRFWSVFQYFKARTLLPQHHPFEEFFALNVEGLREGVTYGDNPNAAFQLQAGRYVEYLPNWIDALEGRLAVLTTDALAADPQGVVGSIAAWLGLDPVVPALDVTRQNVTRRPRRFIGLHRLAGRVNERGEQFFRRHPRLEDHLRSTYYRLNGQPPQRMTVAQRECLDEIYRDDMLRLADLLASGRIRGPMLGVEGLLSSV